MIQRTLNFLGDRDHHADSTTQDLGNMRVVPFY